MLLLKAYVGLIALCLLNWALPFVSAGSETIGVNPDCPFSADVKRILHVPEKRQIMIELHDFRRCKKPSFVVRLSGPAIFKLDLTEHYFEEYYMSRSSDFFKPWSTIYYFSYPQIYDPGLYFLEIMIIFCSELNPEGFASICLESVQGRKNIVNALYSVNLEASNISASGSGERTGGEMRWKLDSVDSNGHEVESSFLPTRYQKMDCGGSLPHYCEPQEKELEQHRKYSLIGAPDWKKAFENVNTVESTQNAAGTGIASNMRMVQHVCFIGASHARQLHLAAEKLSGHDKRMKSVWIESRYPSEFRAVYLEQFSCHYAIIGYGQWPLSWYRHGSPYTAKQYHDEMSKLLGSLSGIAVGNRATGGGTDTGRGVKVFVRSVNYNSLGGFITTCPPVDYRSPPIIDMMNDILRSLTQQPSFQHIPFIDLNPIVGPLWDSALDYCHYHGKVFDAEAAYILYSIFSSSIVANNDTTIATATAASTAAGTGTTAPDSSHREVTTADGHGVTLKSGDVIRFTDSRALYLYGQSERATDALGPSSSDMSSSSWDNQIQQYTLREFPDWDTFMETGFKDTAQKIIVLDANTYRDKFSFDSVLPKKSKILQ